MKVSDESLVKFADMFAALGTERRLRILRALLSAHPDGLVVGEIQTETGVAGSTLSHHLEKLRHKELVTVEREKTFLRYKANAASLEQLLGFFYTECCARDRPIEPKRIIALCK
jgi:ArsR family transcriptional regulator, arsenate/arsenite/antimonite-responsive transcriptional repressor